MFAKLSAKKASQATDNSISSSSNLKNNTGTKKLGRLINLVNSD